jgi:hypothetical protein
MRHAARHVICSESFLKTDFAMNLVSRNRTRRLNTAATLLLAGLFLHTATRLPAQTNTSARPSAVTTARPPAHTAPANRFLFIVDTSSALKKKSADAIREVENILHTAASGQIHMGDTIGLWTFNETLYAGKFPLQQWGHDNGDEIALRAGAFLKEQKFEKTSHLEPALSGMQQVVKGSDIITIFIVSDGSGRMQSTPFDDQINAQYQQNVQEMKKDPQPIITVLQARNGEFVNFTVNRMPWPVVIPPLPIPLKSKQVASAPAATTNAAAAPAAATNIVATTPPPTVVPRQAPTNAAPQVAATATVFPPLTNVPSQPKPVVAPQATAVATSAVPPPVIHPGTPTPPSVDTPASVIIAQAMQQKAAAQGSNTAIAATAQKPPEASVAPPRPPASSNALPAVPRPVTSASNNAAAAQTGPKSISNAPSNAVAKVEPHPDTGGGSNTLAVQAAALVKAYTAGPRKYYLLGGVAFLFMGLWVLKAMVRRANKRAKISLITQSLQNQDQF